jgi:hypothetical protein
MARSKNYRMVVTALASLVLFQIGSRSTVRGADPIPAPDSTDPNGWHNHIPAGFYYDTKATATIIHLPVPDFRENDHAKPTAVTTLNDVPVPSLFAPPAQIKVAHFVPNDLLAPAGLTPDTAPIGRAPSNASTGTLVITGIGSPATRPLTTRNVPSSNAR